MEDDNHVIDIRDLAREAVQPFTGERVHFAIIPHGSQIASLAAYQYPHGLPPDRIVAVPRFQDTASFCSYVNLFKDDRTRVFADQPSATFLALIDYHGVGSDRKPEFVSHKANLTMRLSEEWRIWTALDTKLVPQTEFAEFLEDNRSDIVNPDSATMLEIARDLQAHTEVNFASKVNSRNGAAVLQYEENISAKVTSGAIEVPESFTIRIPVFFGEAPIELTARLRFRITEGKLKFQYKLYRPAEIIHQAFELARADVMQAITLDVLLGTP